MNDILLEDSPTLAGFFEWLQNENFLPTSYNWTISQMTKIMDGTYIIVWAGYSKVWPKDELHIRTWLSYDDLDTRKFSKCIVESE